MKPYFYRLLIFKFVKYLQLKTGFKENQYNFCYRCGRDSAFVFGLKNKVWNNLPEKHRNNTYCIDCFLKIINDPNFKLKKTDFNYIGNICPQDYK